jgi:hypothetical protein
MGIFELLQLLKAENTRRWSGDKKRLKNDPFRDIIFK